MKYDEIKNALFATGTVPDGYFGDRAKVGFHFDKASGHTVTVCDCGFFRTGIPQAVDENEALWLLKNHPTANGIRIN